MRFTGLKLKGDAVEIGGVMRRLVAERRGRGYRTIYPRFYSTRGMLSTREYEQVLYTMHSVCAFGCSVDKQDANYVVQQEWTCHS